jgi:hypothetical protein
VCVHDAVSEWAVGQTSLPYRLLRSVIASVGLKGAEFALPNIRGFHNRPPAG